MASIVLFADGTGNARTARFRTNVWKLYDALEDRPGTGQIGFYHDGVGTSALAPLRVLGGVFGFGLGRNVRALYSFLCRNLSSEDDEIYLFGFSRGAFTVRVLAGMIHCQGVRHITDEAELAKWVNQAYRANRLRLALAQVGFVRAFLIRAGSRLLGLARPAPRWSEPPLRPSVRLLGVWDTVAAYGGPIVEMVRGFDRWIWPLSMPDYRLSDTVVAARHALSLDEEREAFLPLPWDEVGSRDPGRIRQVWFAGVHSDVGGGYADEGLSGIPLAWMLGEAKAAGLRFREAAESIIEDVSNAWGPMHDSRSGMGAAYRYQPRSIDALMGSERVSPLRDPASGDGPMIRRAVVHPSVLSRIRDPDGYAPIVLPSTFEDEAGCRIDLPAECRDRIWRLVARRRGMQRLLLATCAAAVVAPILPKPPVVAFVDQGLSLPLGTALAAVPLVPAWLKESYAASGTWLVACAALAWLWLALGERLRVGINAASAATWAARIVTPPGTAVAEKRGLDRRTGPAAISSPLVNAWRLDLQRRLRWRILPAVFGLGAYAVAALAFAVVGAQVALLAREADGRICMGGGSPGAVFHTSEPCHLTGAAMRRGRAYRVRLRVLEPWYDASIPASPTGFTAFEAFSTRWAAGGREPAARGLAAQLLGAPFRREVPQRWFAPVVAIRAGGSPWLYKVPLAPREGDDGAFYARFVAPADGAAWIYVNDALLPWRRPDAFYANNRGSAEVVIDEER